MNWAMKLTIAMIIYAMILVAMVVVSMRQDISLVADDYYAQEIQYQSRIDDINNYKALGSPLNIKYLKANQTAEVAIPQGDENTKGTIVFFRPSDARFDFEQSIALDSNGQQQLDLSGKVPGLWKIKVAWTDNGKAYFDEQNIVL
jgi:hypothetical protein